jgi:hypothetical protein
VVWPLEAGIGATPARRAKAASERTRPRCDQATISWAATIGPTPGSSSNSGASAHDTRGVGVKLRSNPESVDVARQATEVIVLEHSRREGAGCLRGASGSRETTISPKASPSSSDCCSRSANYRRSMIVAKNQPVGRSPRRRHSHRCRSTSIRLARRFSRRSTTRISTSRTSTNAAGKK